MFGNDLSCGASGFLSSPMKSTYSGDRKLFCFAPGVSFFGTVPVINLGLITRKPYMYCFGILPMDFCFKFQSFLGVLAKKGLESFAY